MKQINTPSLQIALDTPDVYHVKNILNDLPDDDRIIIEAGTPLIKRYGLDIIEYIQSFVPESTIIVADMKTLDTGALETQIVEESGADAIVVAGLAPIETINNVISAARDHGICSIIDTINIANPLPMLNSLEELPDVVELHRAIDQEHYTHGWGFIPTIKRIHSGLFIATAGGIQIDNVHEAIEFGADIVVVGRGITSTTGPGAAMIQEFLDRL